MVEDVEKAVRVGRRRAGGRPLVKSPECGALVFHGSHRRGRCGHARLRGGDDNVEAVAMSGIRRCRHREEGSSEGKLVLCVQVSPFDGGVKLRVLACSGGRMMECSPAVLFALIPSNLSLFGACYAQGQIAPRGNEQRLIMTETRRQGHTIRFRTRTACQDRRLHEIEIGSLPQHPQDRHAAPGVLRPLCGWRISAECAGASNCGLEALEIDQHCCSDDGRALEAPLRRSFESVS